MSNLNLSEEEVLVYVRRVKKGDGDAFRKVEHAFKQEIDRMAREFYLQGAKEGIFDEDIKAIILGALWKACMDFKEEYKSTFKSFANLCFKRNAITAIINAKSRKHDILTRAHSLDRASHIDDEGEQYLAEILPDTRPSILDEIIRQEEFDTKFEALRSICTPLENDVLTLYSESESYNKIAKDIQRNAKAVDNSITRIKKKALLIEVEV